jgi:hypothetical protein
MTADAGADAAVAASPTPSQPVAPPSVAPTAAPAETPIVVPDAGAERGPVFIAGPDRSGTTLMFALLASHPNLSMVRRTNFWRYFHRRYGDLSDPANLDRCIGDLVRYKRLRPLAPDAERLRREFLAGPPTYGRLLALVHEHHAERQGKERWGDKSLHSEHHAARIFAEFPDARIVHMVRDPRDRYASTIKRHGRNVHRPAAAAARWRMSTKAAKRNAARWPDRYLRVRYEDLVRAPDTTMRLVCSFIGEPYVPEMLAMAGVPTHTVAGANSSFGDLEPGAISTKGIGRYRTLLSPEELRFLETTLGRAEESVGYQREEAPLLLTTWPHYYGWFFPSNLARMIAWTAVSRVRIARGRSLPASRLDPPATSKPGPTWEEDVHDG